MVLKGKRKTLVVQEMERAIASGVAVDISHCEKTPEGWYKLPDEKLTDSDLCVTATGQWIKSVGRNLRTNELFASEAEHTFFPPKLGWACVWVR